MFSLGVIAYQMLTGKIALWRADRRRRGRARSSTGCATGRRRMAIATCRNGSTGTLEKAVHPNPYKRYDSLSEFLFDLRHAQCELSHDLIDAPLIERNPLLFWKSTAVVLALP